MTAATNRHQRPMWATSRKSPALDHVIATVVDDSCTGHFSFVSPCLLIVFCFFSKLRVDLFLDLTTRRELFSLQSAVFLAWFLSWFFYPSVEHFVWIVLTSSLLKFIWACYCVSCLHLGLALQYPNKTSQSATALPSTCSISTEMAATKSNVAHLPVFRNCLK